MQYLNGTHLNRLNVVISSTNPDSLNASHNWLSFPFKPPAADSLNARNNWLSLPFKLRWLIGQEFDSQRSLRSKSHKRIIQFFLLLLRCAASLLFCTVAVLHNVEIETHKETQQQTNKQTNKQTKKQTKKQTNKHTKKVVSTLQESNRRPPWRSPHALPLEQEFELMNVAKHHCDSFRSSDTRARALAFHSVFGLALHQYSLVTSSEWCNR